jgi:hypothetical protein
MDLSDCPFQRDPLTQSMIDLELAGHRCDGAPTKARGQVHRERSHHTLTAKRGITLTHNDSVSAAAGEGVLRVFPHNAGGVL